MTDWVRLAGGTTDAGTESAGAEDQDDERYRDILRVYQRKDADVVVDVGANDGRAYFKFGIGKGRTFIGIDVSHLLLAEFMRRVPDQTALQADGICLPLKDSTVDFLFCTETLEHLADPQQAMLEFGRVLRPGGRLIIQSPNAHRIRNLNPFHIATNALSLLNDRVLQKKVVHENTWLNAATYHWDFSVQDYRRMAGKAGLKVTELRSGQFFFPRFLLSGGPDAFRRKEKFVASIPLFRMLGGDLVLVAQAWAMMK
jgi:ubiquinone/menaquinone biosynthesis C-methylase UbiE